MKVVIVDELKDWVENWISMDNNYTSLPYYKEQVIPISELYDILEQIPDATETFEKVLVEKRNKSKWELFEKVSPRRYRCSWCNHLSWDQTNYCPSCGCRMVDKE